MEAKDLVGAWKGLGHDVTAADGTVTHPHGTDTNAYMIYTPDGFVSLMASKNDRKKFSGDVSGRDLKSATTEEKAQAAGDCIAFAGRYEMSGEKLLIHIEIALFPNWEGTTEIRYPQFDGDQLTLTMPPEPDGAVGRVRWQRM